MSDWKNVQYKDGKMQTSEGGGGGGSSTFAGLDDVSFDNIQNGQVPKYNSTTQKWENADESGGGGTVTDVQVDGVSVVNAQGVAEIPEIPTVNVDDVKVNGTSVVDANGVAQITSYEEVTQSEYDALPASKTSNGIAYFIKDGGTADGIKVFSLGDIYDTEEHEIGVWIDGKPLYQKTIDFGALPNKTTKTIAHNISGVNGQSFCKIEVIISTATTGYSTFQRVHDRDVKYQAFWEVTSTGIICYSRENDNSGYVRCFVTLIYTKTTDVAGSGTLAQGGAPAHHYSTSEKVVGTWIDGKPIYEKTFLVPIVSGNSNYNHGISNIGQVTKIEAITKSSTSNNEYRVINFVYSIIQDSSSAWYSGITVNSSNIVIQSGSSFATRHTQAYVTLQYTKTTD